MSLILTSERYGKVAEEGGLACSRWVYPLVYRYVH